MFPERNITQHDPQQAASYPPLSEGGLALNEWQAFELVAAAQAEGRVLFEWHDQTLDTYTPALASWDRQTVPAWEWVSSIRFEDDVPREQAQLRVAFALGVV